MKMSKRLAACAVTGAVGLSLAAATLSASPASAATRPALPAGIVLPSGHGQSKVNVHPNGIYSATVNDTYSQTIDNAGDVAYSATLQINASWNGSGVWLNSANYWGSNAWWSTARYRWDASSKGSYYVNSNNNLIIWANVGFGTKVPYWLPIVGWQYTTIYSCVYLRININKYGQVYPQNWLTQKWLDSSAC